MVIFRSDTKSNAHWMYCDIGKLQMFVTSTLTVILVSRTLHCDKGLGGEGGGVGTSLLCASAVVDI